MSISQPSHVPKVKDPCDYLFQKPVVNTDEILSQKNTLQGRILSEIEKYGNMISVSQAEYQQEKQKGAIPPKAIRDAVKIYLVHCVEALIYEYREADVKLADIPDIQKKRIAGVVNMGEFDQNKLIQDFPKGDKYYDFLLISPEEVIDEYIAAMEL